jgi:hypothetical protein
MDLIVTDQYPGIAGLFWDAFSSSFSPQADTERMVRNAMNTD